MITVEQAFGKHAHRVVAIRGECWIWESAPTGTMRLPGIRLYRETRTAVSLAYENLGWKYPGNLVMTCETDRCVNPEHATWSQSVAGRMVYIRERVRKEGECEIWTGPPDQRVHWEPWVRKDIAAKALVWCAENIPSGFEWPKDTRSARYETRCGRKDCVSWRHVQRITDGAVDDGRY